VETPFINKDIRERFEEYLLTEKNGGLQPDSVKAYLTHINYLYIEAKDDILKTCLKYKDVASLIRSVRQNRKGKRADTWSANMTSKCADMVKVFFTWAAREGIIEYNPMQFGHEFKKSKSPMPRYFKDSATIERILHFPGNTLREKAIFHVLLASGIRGIELCRLNVDDLFLEERYIRVIEGKGGQYRMAYIKPETVEVLKRYLKGIPGQTALFTNSKGERLKRDTLTKFVIRRGKKIGVEMSPHVFRHTVGRNMRRSGAQLADIADVLGHKSLNSTRIYATLENEEIRNKYDQFNTQPA